MLKKTNCREIKIDFIVKTAKRCPGDLKSATDSQSCCVRLRGAKYLKLHGFASLTLSSFSGFLNQDPAFVLQEHLILTPDMSEGCAAHKNKVPQSLVNSYLLFSYSVSKFCS